jgi:hypothetical protein
LAKLAVISWKLAEVSEKLAVISGKLAVISEKLAVISEKLAETKEVFIMSRGRKWMPSTKEKILEMCKTWLEVIASKLELWNIRKGVLEALQLAYDDGVAALEKIIKKGKATGEDIADANKKFNIIKKQMQVLKRNTFHIPTLEVEDFITLNLKAPDDRATPSIVPKSVAKVEQSGEIWNRDAKKNKPVTRNMHKLIFQYLGGDEEEPYNRRFMVRSAAVAEHGAAITDPELLTKTKYVTAHKFTMQYDEIYHHGMAYYQVFVMNGDLVGPPGPIIAVEIN